MLFQGVAPDMKILFVWPGLTGYMGDCWRALAHRDGVELRIVVDLSDTHYGAGFDASDVMRGLDWSDALPEGWIPDVAFIVGWRNGLCRTAALSSALEGVPKVCCFDMPWEWRLRKFVARFALRSYLRRFAAAYVPGAASRPYAKWLGFNRIYEGLFATDLRRFGSAVDEDGSRGGFLYVGRESPEKGTDVLRAAHSLYRERGGTWNLRIVSNASPSELGAVYGSAGAFVLASRWEPWGVVLAEAAGAGLPIICTDRCGARHEVVRDGVNGRIVKAGCVRALADAMLEAESGKFDGPAGRALASNYGCGPWADRVLKICEELTCSEG